MTVQTLCSTRCGLLTDKQHIFIGVSRNPDFEVDMKISGNFGQATQYQEMMERRIRIITEYEQKCVIIVCHLWTLYLIFKG